MLLRAPHRNKDVVDKYAHDVVVAYANGFVQDVVLGAAMRTAANDLMQAAAEVAHVAEVERVRTENVRVAELHGKEVVDKKSKEEKYKTVRPGRVEGEGQRGGQPGGEGGD